MGDLTPTSLWTQHPMSKGGKMAGMWSWGNTNPLNNSFCMNTCSFKNHCYAKRYCMIRPYVSKAYTENGNHLKKILPDRYLSWAPLGSHRIQAFGEILNTSHWKNIIRLCELNQQSKFTIWTKKWKLIEKSGIRKPLNLQIIASGDYLSNEEIIGYPTFLVSKEPPKKYHIVCKGRCIDCQYCYGWARHAELDPDIPIWEHPR